MERILILDFGSQYTMLIARRIREMNVYCDIVPFNRIPAITPDVKGIILSGSPSSVRGENAPQPDLSGVPAGMPILGICYGAQWLAWSRGGNVAATGGREYGRAILSVKDAKDPLLKDVADESQVWMSHGDTITVLPKGYKIIASTEAVDNAAFRVEGKPVWGIQFHAEVHHTEFGKQILRNYVLGICGCAGSWTPASFVESTVASLKEQIGSDKVVLGLSGGVDSSVAALLLHKAIGKQLHCIFVDSGLLRKDEFTSVLASYKGMGLNVKGVDASAKFLGDLAGVTDPEQKRKTIGKDFVEVFNAEAEKIENVRWLAQGTIYPDVIESSAAPGASQTIKSHHNVGGLPKEMKLQIVEPLRLLFKDEVRRVGKVLGLDPDILGRHPFPGPGLGIRILGEVTADKVVQVQEADKIFIDALKRHGLYDQVWQAGAILLPIKSVGVMGDERSYENTIALRAVTSVDGMTADWVRLPYDFLAEVSDAIIRGVKGVNRVVYDICSKPPATIEWE